LITTRSFVPACANSFSLEVLTIGAIDVEVDAHYVQSLAWYHTMAEVLGENDY